MTHSEQPDSTPPSSARGSIVSGRWVGETVRVLVVAIALFLLVRTFGVEAYRIPSASMQGTLRVGDFLLVDKAAFGSPLPGTKLRLPGWRDPGHGDIVIFVPPHDPERMYVKRVVGLPGDTLAMKDGVLYVDGVARHEPYTHRLADDSSRDVAAPAMFWQLDYFPGGPVSVGRPTRDNWGPLVVPKDDYFVLGDNRDDSEDSRYWGFVPRNSVRGTPVIVYYSYDPDTLDPLPWLTRIRWDRIGRWVR